MECDRHVEVHADSSFFKEDAKGYVLKEDPKGYVLKGLLVPFLLCSQF